MPEPPLMDGSGISIMGQFCFSIFFKSLGTRMCINYVTFAPNQLEYPLYKQWKAWPYLLK